MTRYDFQLTLAEADLLREALCVQLQHARDVHHRSRDEHINKAHSLLKILECQVRDIQKFEEQCALRAEQGPEYLVGI